MTSLYYGWMLQYGDFFGLLLWHAGGPSVTTYENYVVCPTTYDGIDDDISVSSFNFRYLVWPFVQQINFLNTLIHSWTKSVYSHQHERPNGIRNWSVLATISLFTLLKLGELHLAGRNPLRLSRQWITYWKWDCQIKWVATFYIKVCT